MNEVKIADQVWAAENLSTIKFSDGSEVTICKNSKEWETLNKKCKPAACAFEFDNNNIEKFGLLYNWYAVTDSKILAPEGWRIPKLEDWKVMIGSNDMKKFGANLKSKELWAKPKSNNNSTGLSILPAGTFVFGDFNKEITTFWTSTDGSIEGYAISVSLSGENPKITFGTNFKDLGFSVRCVKV